MSALILNLVPQMSVFVVVAFVVGRARWLHRLEAGGAFWPHRLVLILVGALMCIAGTYWGVPTYGAIANTRVIGATFAGLAGGPLVGLAAGLIGGVHRYFIGGFTALACGISTTTEGLVAGLLWYGFKRRSFTGWQAFFITAGLEVLQMAIILAVARPFAAAWALVQVIAIPMIVVNATGSGLVFYILRDSDGHRERIGAAQAHKALAIANRTLPFMRAGMSTESMQEVVRVLKEQSGAAAVSITDGRMILAYTGVGVDHHRPGTPPRTQATRELLLDGRTRVMANHDEIGCSDPGCPLSGGVAVPLYDQDRVVGTLNFFVTDGREVSPVIVELAQGLGQLLSTQLEVARLQSMPALLAKAELRALQAQINPHFLFNALNTISALCRREPERARQVIGFLSHYLRSSMRTAESTVTLREEVELVVAYLAIEQARFGDRLTSQIEIPTELMNWPVPVFSLQPLVENSVRHGLMPKPGGGMVRLVGEVRHGHLTLTVSDDGVGLAAAGGALPPPTGNGIGMKNVKERLRHLYGDAAQLQVESEPERGCTVTLVLPLPEQQLAVPVKEVAT